MTGGSSAAAPAHARGAWWGYLAGLLLLGHVLVMNVAGGRWLDWNAFAARWSNPLWLIWDSLLVAVVGSGLTLAAVRGRQRTGSVGIVIAGLVAVVTVAALIAIWTLDTCLRE